MKNLKTLLTAFILILAFSGFSQRDDEYMLRQCGYTMEEVDTVYSAFGTTGSTYSFIKKGDVTIDWYEHYEFKSECELEIIGKTISIKRKGFDDYYFTNTYRSTKTNKSKYFDKTTYVMGRLIKYLRLL